MVYLTQKVAIVLTSDGPFFPRSAEHLVGWLLRSGLPLRLGAVFHEGVCNGSGKKKRVRRIGHLPILLLSPFERACFCPGPSNAPSCDTFEIPRNACRPLVAYQRNTNQPWKRTLPARSGRTGDGQRARQYADPKQIVLHSRMWICKPRGVCIHHHGRFERRQRPGGYESFGGGRDPLGAHEPPLSGVRTGCRSP